MTGLKIHTNIAIPIASGDHLSATLFLPDSAQPSPCILALTPYGADAQHERGKRFATHGFAYAAVDVRGRGNSGGLFEPQTNEPLDGPDVVGWLSIQPFCNGKVGMCGASYLGYTQWATIAGLPDALATIVPTAAPCPGIDSPMRSNIVAPERLQWAALVSGRTVQAKLFEDEDYWSNVLRDWFVSGACFRDLDTFAGQSCKILQRILDHPHLDAHWRSKWPTSAQYARIDRPVLTITGAYDDDQPGALAHYRAHVAARGQDERHYLIIGPWNHAGTVTPKQAYGGLEVGPASVIDMPALHLEWFNWAMCDGRKPPFLQDKIMYYVIGAEQWQSAPDLPSVTESTRALYLNSGGEGRPGTTGTLAATFANGRPDRYRYDPRVVDGPEIEAEHRTPKGTIVGNELVEALAERQLVYDTVPFEDEVVIAGFFKLEASIGIDCPDTDLYATIYEVDREGLHTRLSTDAIRARFRQSLERPALVSDESPQPYIFDRFTFVARVCRAGHRIRLVISPTGRLVDTQFCQKNFNAGGVVADETAAVGRPVTVQLHHDHENPSVLHLPIGSLRRPSNLER